MNKKIGFWRWWFKNNGAWKLFAIYGIIVTVIGFYILITTDMTYKIDSNLGILWFMLHLYCIGRMAILGILGFILGKTL